jgi:hypothetical protein
MPWLAGWKLEGKLMLLRASFEPHSDRESHDLRVATRQGVASFTDGPWNAVASKIATVRRPPMKMRPRMPLPPLLRIALALLRPTPRRVKYLRGDPSNCPRMGCAPATLLSTGNFIRSGWPRRPCLLL